MVKWKLFNWLKTKEEVETNGKLATEEIQKSEEKQIKPKIKEEAKEVPIKEYNETLYSKGFAQKEPMALYQEKKQPLKRTSWENSETIEHTVDSMRQKQKGTRTNSTQTIIDTDKKVDFILLKKKKKV